jgi:hypothetical protein
VVPYATSSDYQAGPPPRTAPPNIDALLWTATFRVANACNRNPYSDTPTGATAAALRDATTAQAAFWATVGTDPDAGGLDVAPVKRSVLLDATIETDTTGQVEALASCDVCDTARAILLAANLLWQPVPIGDQTPPYAYLGWGTYGAYGIQPLPAGYVWGADPIWP